MNPLLRKAALILLVTLPLPAAAHKMWLLPSATVLSEGQWITVDAAVSNDLFYFNHVPLRLDNLAVTGPDGKPVAVEGRHGGKYRSVFDVELAAPGTYRIAVVNDGLFANWQEGGQPKRWRGPAGRFSAEVPADADGLEVTRAQGRIETFVTAGAPNEAALTPIGTGLELIPVTHPNDLYAGEPASFRLQLDGKPAAGVDVTIIPGGTRYRDHQDETVIKTVDDGSFAITWPAAGMYWLEAVVGDERAAAPATKRRATYIATFEVLPQ